MRLKDLCEFKTNFPEADFWLNKKGTSKTVGSPTKEFSPENIGVKVIRTDILLPDYLFYVFQDLVNRGVIYNITKYSDNTLEEIKNIKVG
jgi:hypothetical protein